MRIQREEKRPSGCFTQTRVASKKNSSIHMTSTTPDMPHYIKHRLLIYASKKCAGNALLANLSVLLPIVFRGGHDLRNFVKLPLNFLGGDIRRCAKIVGDIAYAMGTNLS